MKRRHSDSKMTLRESFERHYDKTDLRQRSLQKMRHTLTLWERHTNNPPVGQITNETLQQFKDNALKSLSGVSVNGSWTTIRAILRRLAPPEYRNPAGLSIIERVPYMKPCKVTRKPPRRVDLDDLTKVYIACKFAQLPRSGIPAPDWWRALIVVAYFSGLRKSDLLSLTWEQVDLDRGCLTFTAEKTGKYDTFPLHSIAVEHLKRVRRPVGRVFPGLGKRGGPFYKILHAIMRDAKIERGFGLHDLRRTGASEIERVRQGLGKVFLQHAARSHTEASYTNMMPELCEAIPEMRVPTGWGPGPKMQERAEERRLRERVQLRPEEFVAPLMPNPAEWQFRPGTYWLRGDWHRLGGRRLNALQTLATAAEPVAVRTLVQALFGETADVDSPELQRRVVTIVAAVRAHLRSEFLLETDFDPIPCLEYGKGGLWTLSLPLKLATNREPRGGGMTPGEQIRRARKRAKLTIVQLANRIGAHRSSVQRWESGATEIPPAWLDAIRRALAEHFDDRCQRPQTGERLLTGEELRRARKHAGLTQRELARRVGTFSVAVSRWETGREPIPRHWQERIREVLGQFLLDAPEPCSVPAPTGAEIRRARQRLGLSRVHLAAALNVSRKTLEGWEQNRCGPSVESANALRLVLQLADRMPARTRRGDAA